MNRKDGIKIKNRNGMQGLMPFILKKRCDSEVYINAKIDVTNLVKYKESLNKDKNITYFHLFATAASKLFYNRPLLNRFIINKTYYDRKNVSLSFVAKKEFNDTSEENLTVINIQKDDNLFTISDKIKGDVKSIRSKQNNSTDDFIDKIGKLPKFIRSIIMGIVKFADNHDLLPKSLTANSIYHSSLVLSNLGSINCDAAIYHHLTDFGTNSIFMTIGKIKDEDRIINGKNQKRKICEFGLVLDERIADGYYFVKSLELFEYILNNPKLLEDNVNIKINK